MITRSLTRLLTETAERCPQAEALRVGSTTCTYGTLFENCTAFAASLIGRGVAAGDRIAVYLGKRQETVVSMFGAGFARAAFVPINPVLKPTQVAHILEDSGAWVLVTNRQRLLATEEVIARRGLRLIVVIDEFDTDSFGGVPVVAWQDLISVPGAVRAPQETDVAAILYTSGSTGRPKGVTLSHANMAIGAVSVASYLGNSSADRILSLLPLSFDAGFSQLSTAFSVGASVTLLDYLIPRDVVNAVARHEITGITAVPPLWHQMAEQQWAEGAGESLRYFANTGGKMPATLLQKLRGLFPHAKPFLMYGLTEAFRSSFLDPLLVDSKPNSIGRAIPNVELFVVGADGELCGPNQPGELVHAGPLVAMGYWNDVERTAQRFRPSPVAPPGLPVAPLAVWSGDQVVMDEDGDLFFIGREDEMIKSSGYRISPTEVEEAALDCHAVAEVAVFGAPDDKRGQTVLLVARPAGEPDLDGLMKHLSSRLPTYMVPSRVIWRTDLPRNPNGKIDRTMLKAELAEELAER
jgi:acyl-CoA ligase (AMP-forming) (exosortase A-associated)